MVIYSLADPIAWAKSLAWFLAAVAILAVIVVSVLYMLLHVAIKTVLGCE